MVDCPVISIGFDGDEELPYDRSARRGLDFTHIKKMLALGGVRVARSFADLEAHINAYLRAPLPGSRRARPHGSARVWPTRWLCRDTCRHNVRGPVPTENARQADRIGKGRRHRGITRFICRHVPLRT